MKSKTGNNQFLKNYNQTAILDIIRQKKSLSRMQLSKATGLSPTATGAIVSNLIEKGYIYETGAGSSSGGRRPVMLELVPGSYFSAGVDLEVGCINLVLMDITGSVICERIKVHNDHADIEKTVKLIRNLLDELLADYKIRQDKLLGIGISVPGMVSADTHKIILAPNLGWKNIDFIALMGGYHGIPLYVENEAMSSAICEHWLGSCQGINDFICVNIKSGIGAAIFTHGKLYRGAGGSAGEVGHIVVDENGPRCACGNYGCLETVASTSRLAEKAKRLVRQGVVSSLNTEGDIEKINFDSVVKAARAGDETARGILLESARYLGIALSNIVNTINPQKIIIGKEFTKYSDIVMDQIINIISSKALKPAASCVEIAASAFGERSSALGAAIIPLKVLFGR